MNWRRIAILGPGLIGGSLGLAVRRRWAGCEVVGWTRKAETARKGLEVGVAHRFAASAAEAVTGADLVVLCTPVGTFEGILKEISPALAAGAIVTDVGSTKASFVRTAEAVLKAGVSVVGSHPMAGSEKKGPAYASADLFEGAPCITTPGARADESALESVEGMWREVGCRITRLGPEEHDRLMAMVSHLPHATAVALVRVQPDAALPLAAGGFRDSTRVAGGDPQMWHDIFVDNAVAVRAAIAAVKSELDAFDAMLASQDSQAIIRWLSEAADRRRPMFPGLTRLGG